jgi:hypothetical protein
MIIFKLFFDWLRVTRKGLAVSILFILVLVLFYFFPLFVSLLPFTYLGI